MAVFVFSVLGLVVIAGAVLWYVNTPGQFSKPFQRMTAISRKLEVKAVDVPPLNDFMVVQAGSPVARTAKKRPTGGRKTSKKKASKKGQ